MTSGAKDQYEAIRRLLRRGDQGLESWRSLIFEGSGVQKFLENEKGARMIPRP